MNESINLAQYLDIDVQRKAYLELENAYFDEIYYTVIDLLMRKAVKSFMEKYEDEIFSMTIGEDTIKKFVDVYGFVSIKMDSPSIYKILSAVNTNYCIPHKKLSGFAEASEIAYIFDKKVRNVRDSK